MRPSPSLPPGSTPVGLMNQSGTHPDKLIQSDLDGSLALLAGNLSIRPDGQMKRYVPFAFSNVYICVKSMHVQLCRPGKHNLNVVALGCSL